MTTTTFSYYRFKRRVQPVARKVGAVVIFTALLIFILAPFYWMLKSSFQSNIDLVAIPPIWFPSEITMDGYRQAVSLIPFARYITNSLFVSFVTAMIATLLGSAAAYVLARHHFRGATVILALFLLTQLIPGITRIFPIYFLIQNLGLLNSYPGVIMAYVSFSLPYAVMMLQGYFRSSYPTELEEAALIDGCNWFSAFVKVVLPISIPGIVAIWTYTFLGAWNDFLWASLLLNRGEMKTIQVGLRDFIGELGSVNRANAFMAACVLTTIPSVIMFRFAQQGMVQGLSAGAIKG
ncbi:MAG: carbohydrate ABC transporter permease [Anaerolineae bacterium]